jgi:two-component system LytT family sensor kinase
MKLIFALLQQMSVFLVIAYLFSKSPAFRPLTGETLRVKHKILLYFIFSAFSILGTYFGLPVQDAIANTRAIGAVLAGLIGGPLLGTTVGLTGGLHRYALGGFTAFSCGVSTTAEGLLGGLVHLWLLRRGQPEKVFSPKIAFAATFAAEALQMVIILLLARPLVDAVALVQVIAAPMMLANAAGAALFVSIMRDQKSMYDKFGVIFSGRALKIAERTLGILDKEFNPATAAGEVARIIHQETGVGAVAITDRDKVLAYVGLGADHHQAGTAIASELTRRAIEENRVIFADGMHEHYTCTRSADCPLGSALVVPLRLDNEVIGTIKLYEPKRKLFLNLNRTLGEGIARLLSEQLLRSRYEEQKRLLMTSELKLVQAQVNPHFLFNALNTIVAVLRQDAGQARELLLHLSNFFRKNLKRSGDLATLEEELDHVNAYLGIEKVRFADRLRVETAVDPALLPLKMPTFTLQPIVENAIKHGISGMLEPGIVRISGRIEGETAVIEVEDNAGAFCEELKGGGLGMNIVDRRIRNLYGDRYGLAVTCSAGQWTGVALTVPWQEGES